MALEIEIFTRKKILKAKKEISSMYDIQCMLIYIENTKQKLLTKAEYRK